MEDFSVLLKDGKGIFLAYDHGLEHGPSDFPNPEVSDPKFILDLAYKSGFQAVIFQKGIAERFYTPEWQTKISLILKLNGKTNLGKDYKNPYSPLVCSPEYAKELGAVAVGYTIYPGSLYEGVMFKEFGKMAEEAKKLGLIVIAWVYPRGEKIKDENNPEIVKYAARIGLELGADMIKIKYSGSKESFEEAVKLASPVKVFLSGGGKVEEAEFLEVTKNVMEAGAAGLAVGRNIWQSKDPFQIAKKVYNLVFNDP